MDCSVEGCTRPMKYKTLGLCFAHYQKHLRYGTATPDPSMYRKPGRPADPTKWRSRHNPDNPSRSRPKKEKVEQTHCKHGHELSENNRYWNKRTERWVCKTCLKEATRRYREKREVPRDYSKCKNGHPITPENTLTYPNGSTRCRECTVTHMKKGRLKKYGLTVEKYDELLEHKGGACAICKKPMEGFRNEVVDHDHITGAVRGVLHANCNTGLGMFNDDPEMLLNAAKYLMDSWRLHTDSAASSSKTD